ncbi:MAG: response regulator [Planctomycetota bacterium]|nr:response regulator [Planctomycetota bacterium]
MAPQPQSPPAQPPPAGLRTTGLQKRARFVFDERGGAAPIPAPPPPPPPPKAETTPSAGSKPLPQPGVASGVRVTAKLVAAKQLILIADADKRARMVFRLRLEGNGFQVVECGTADEAWQRIEAGGVSVTILDIALPGESMSGADVISRITSTSPGMAVVVLGVKDEAWADHLRRTLQRSQYLESPAPADRVARAVKELLSPQGGGAAALRRRKPPSRSPKPVPARMPCPSSRTGSVPPHTPPR